MRATPTVLATCPNGYAFLLAHQYTINNQQVTRFSVEIFDKTGNSKGSKDVGSFVKEKEGYFKTLDFKISRDGNSIFIDATERFHNGNRQKNGVGFNTEEKNQNGGSGNGLLNMKNRMELLGCHYNIQSEPGKGCTVTAFGII